jgi:two-component system, NtrC family, response regulator AtoC
LKAKILIIDDEKDLCWAIRERLRQEGYAADYVLSGEEALERMKRESFDVALLDYKMPGMNGLETLKIIKREYGETSVIFITAHGDQNLALESLRLGAGDFIHKPFNLENLLFRIYKTLRIHTLENEVDALRPRVRKSFADIIFKSGEIKKMLDIIDRVAPKNAPVLLTGETGVGKDLVASAIHHNTYNPRKDKPYLTINCGAIPEPLIESELFGHTKGAFTGAVAARKGLFEAADGGTVFLDEISSASLFLQTKLLRALDTGEFYAVGDSNIRKVDVRIIAASNKDMYREVAEGNFREDLFHRLKVIHIDIPPLRERKDDIAPLIDYFLKFHNRQMGKNVRLTGDAREAIKGCHWSGNVRELKHFIENLVVLSRKNEVALADLPKERLASLDANDDNSAYRHLKARVVADFDKAYFENLLKECRGNVSKAARKSELARSYLIKKLGEHGINPKEYN